MCPPEHVCLGWVSFCVKQSVLCFTLVCCVLCELCESLLALEWCKSRGVAGVKAASPVWWLLPSREKFPILISFLSSLMCRPWGIRLKRERNEVCINPKGISPWVTLCECLVAESFPPCARARGSWSSSLFMYNWCGKRLYFYALSAGRMRGVACRFGFTHDH